MGYFDAILRANNEDEHRKFISRFREARDDIVSFVNDVMGWDGTGEYHRWLRGSFNIGYVIQRHGSSNGDDKGSVFIRFPIPGRTYTPWRSEKVQDEVMVLRFLREHTTIPVPRVHSWGLAEDSPRHLGPFIIMDFVDGACLDDLLKKPTENSSDPLILDPDMDVEKHKIVYSQIADYTLQLARLPLSKIGAISENSGKWDVTQRPMTYDMNELVGDKGVPPQDLPTESFGSTSDYFRQRAKELWSQLCTQRNICETEEETRQKFIARRRLEQLIPKYTTGDDLSFRLFSDDFGPFNMLADPETFKITAVLDFEFTNAMPAQYLFDVPSWLLLASPHCWLERDDKIGFEKLFAQQMDLFVEQVERAEAEFLVSNPDGPALDLSTQMRESWTSGRFWFNYAMRSSIDADVVYWEAMNDEGERVMPDAQEMEKFANMKMEQFRGYLREREGK